MRLQLVFRAGREAIVHMSDMYAQALTFLHRARAMESGVGQIFLDKSDLFKKFTRH
jgi:hypothetical protein